MHSLKGKTVLLTAGPTQEAIDPVRFISNHSSGKMGYALAECLAEEGAIVLLVTGPTALKAQHHNITTYPVVSAEQMYEQCLPLAVRSDVWIFAAAVADYRPRVVADKKIKKKEATLTIELVKNVDIAAALGKFKKSEQFSVGFALETDQETENAQAKLLKKNFDLIILNSLNDTGAGFRHDTNKISIIEKDKMVTFELKPKLEVARDIVQYIGKKVHV